MEARTGAFAIAAIISAIFSFFLTFSGHPFWGMLAALAAIPLGIGGLIMAASPKVSGGVMSIAAIMIGVLAAGVAILGIVGAIIF
jgi:hypothetical protein